MVSYGITFHSSPVFHCIVVFMVFQWINISNILSVGNCFPWILKHPSSLISYRDIFCRICAWLYAITYSWQLGPLLRQLRPLLEDNSDHFWGQLGPIFRVKSNVFRCLYSFFFCKVLNFQMRRCNSICDLSDIVPKRNQWYKKKYYWQKC
jgi:hypothetical protein